MASYWIIEAAGLFFLFGSPVSLFTFFLVNFYVELMTFIGFFTVIIAATGAGGYEQDQVKLLSL